MEAILAQGFNWESPPEGALARQQELLGRFEGSDSVVFMGRSFEGDNYFMGFNHTDDLSNTGMTVTKLTDQELAGICSELSFETYQDKFLEPYREQSDLVGASLDAYERQFAAVNGVLDKHSISIDGFRDSDLGVKSDQSIAGLPNIGEHMTVLSETIDKVTSLEGVEDILGDDLNVLIEAQEEIDGLLGDIPQAVFDNEVLKALEGQFNEMAAGATLTIDFDSRSQPAQHCVNPGYDGPEAEL